MKSAEGIASPVEISRLPDVMTLDEVAVRLRLSRHGVANMAQRGEIPGAMKFGRRWRVSVVAFERALHGEAPIEIGPSSVVSQP